jgi:hypothetical protein
MAPRPSYPTRGARAFRAGVSNANGTDDTLLMVTKDFYIGQRTNANRVSGRHGDCFLREHKFAVKQEPVTAGLGPLA